MNHGKLHHVGMVVPNIDEAAAAYRLLGFEMSGPPVIDEAQRATIAFIQVANSVFIELLEPQGADSPIQGFLERNKGGLHHLCYEVDDLDRWWQVLRSQGAVPVGKPVPAGALENRRIAFMYLKGSLIELLEASHGT